MDIHPEGTNPAVNATAESITNSTVVTTVVLLLQITRMGTKWQLTINTLVQKSDKRWGGEGTSPSTSLTD